MAIDHIDKKDAERRNRLVDAVREIKIAEAERNDVVVEMKEADRARLEILAQELEPVFSEVPLDDERFDFALSSGLQPRLWIDATAHVIMGKDRRQYRFVRDTRLGRIVLAESNQTAPIIDSVTKYIAERIHERELAFAGDDVSYRSGIAQRVNQVVDDEASSSEDESQENEAANLAPQAQKSGSGFGWVMAGLLISAGVLSYIFRADILALLGQWLE